MVDPALAALGEDLADVAALVGPDVIRVGVGLLASAADKGLVKSGHFVVLAEDLT